MVQLMRVRYHLPFTSLTPLMISSGEVVESTVSNTGSSRTVFVELVGRGATHVHFFVRHSQGDSNAVRLHQTY